MAQNDATKYGLGPDAFDRIEQGLAEVRKIDEQIKKARQAGLTMDEEQRLNQENRARLMKIKQTYFPGK